MKINDIIKPSGKDRGAIDQLSGKIIEFAKVVNEKSEEVNNNLVGLTNSLEKNAQSSDRLQEKLILWTKVMTGAIIIQALAIICQIYVSFK